MPFRAKKFCKYPGCNELVVNGYCDLHKKQVEKKNEQQRETAAERGYDSRWNKARRIFLQHNPVCVICMKEGRLTPSKVVDHIIPHKGNKVLFWDKSNWQALCKRCHDKKTAKEDGGWGRGV